MIMNDGKISEFPDLGPVTKKPPDSLTWVTKLQMVVMLMNRRPPSRVTPNIPSVPHCSSCVYKETLVSKVREYLFGLYGYVSSDCFMETDRRPVRNPQILKPVLLWPGRHRQLQWGSQDSAEPIRWWPVFCSRLQLCSTY